MDMLGLVWHVRYPIFFVKTMDKIKIENSSFHQNEKKKIEKLKRFERALSIIKKKTC